MLLSIGMIVKNEEKYLRKCLEGIKPILERVHSELIIADTGSTDGTMDIAREYTSKVYRIEWRDDFAWARNTTIDKALGKWYMFLDADEEFKDVEDIIEFFNSGEYTKYKSAMHDMVILGKSDEAPFKAKRLFKLTKDTRFTGKVHEYPINTSPPLKELKSYSVHYGYVFEDTAEGAERKKKKFERNVKPLLEMHAEDPGDIRIIVQLVKEYGVNNDAKEFEEFLGKGLALKGESRNSTYYDLLRLIRARHYQVTGRYAEAINDVRDYFKDIKTLYALAIELRLIEAESLMRLGRRTEAAESYEKAWKLYEEDDKGRIDHTDLQLTDANALTKNARDGVAKELINYYVDDADDLSRALEWAERTGYCGSDRVVESYVKMKIKEIDENGYKRAAELYNLITGRFGVDSTEYSTAVEAIENAVPDAEAKRGLAEALATGITGDSTDYIRLQRLRLSLFNGDSTVDELGYFLDSEKAFTALYGDVIIAGIMRGISISAFIDKMGVDAAAASAPGIARTNEGLPLIISDYVLECLWDATDFSLKTERFLCALLRILILAGIENEDEIEMAFEAYAKLYRQYLSRVYSPEVLTDEMHGLLPENERFTYFAGKAYDYKEKGDYVRFVSSLREAVANDAGLGGAVKTVINRFQRKLDEEDRVTREKQLKLDQETAALKRVIVGLINAGDRAQAGQTLDAYERINPSDPEIPAIKKMLK